MSEIWDGVFDMNLKLRLSLVVVFLLTGIIIQTIRFPSSIFEAFQFSFTEF
jgi:hypothetical protein